MTMVIMNPRTHCLPAIMAAGWMQSVFKVSAET